MVRRAGQRSILSARAFSLLELLVALSVFALATAMAYGGLARLVETRRALAAEQERLARMLFAFGLFERDLRAALPRPVRDATGAVRAAFVGEMASVEWTVTQPLPMGGAGLARVLYRLEGRDVVLERFPIADRAPASPVHRERLLTEVSRWELRFLDHEGRWQREWSAGERTLPRAVELTVSLPGWGELRRVIALARAP